MTLLIAIFTFLAAMMSETDGDEQKALSAAWGEEGESADWLELGGILGSSAIDAVPTFTETAKQITLANDLGYYEAIGGSEGLSTSELISKYALPALGILAFAYLTSRLLGGNSNS